MEDILFTAIKQNIVTSPDEVEQVVEKHPGLFKKEVVLSLTPEAEEQFVTRLAVEKMPLPKLLDHLEENLEDAPELAGSGNLEAKQGDYVIYWRRNRPECHASFCEANPESIAIGQLRSDYMGKFNIAGICFNSFQPRPELSNLTVDARDLQKYVKMVDYHVKEGLNFKKQGELEKIFERGEVRNVQEMIKHFLELRACEM